MPNNQNACFKIEHLATDYRLSLRYVMQNAMYKITGTTRKHDASFLIEMIVIVVVINRNIVMIDRFIFRRFIGVFA